jgi:hypothetical protein
MNIPDEMAIELSKKKWLLIIALSALFVIMGFWVLTLDPEAVKSLDSNSTKVHVYGWVLVICFGGIGIHGLIKLFDKKPGLQFTKTGVIDNTCSGSAGLIPWSDILGTEIYDEPSGQRMLVVKVTNPDRYIETGGSLQRSAKKANLYMCGSPIKISSIGLKINFDELVDIFNAYISRYGMNS